ncbi:MAG TPA: CAP domain-containing protein [Gaiellaceae bacterium]|nr:CAP domain-containing protein [Gaiellaceae bacterium]
MLKVVIGACLTVALLVPATALARTARTSRATALLDAMNSVRRQHGLRPLRIDAHLERAARSHSDAMVADDVFQHGAFGSRMLRFHVTGTVAGENLAWGTGTRGTAMGIVRAWLASPAHRANLLRPSFDRVGVGSVVATFLGNRNANVVTADFAG